mmetsp:Transcript_17516/g.57835  ORF Transcript_17516/g.57835 Transcript_17516/m.57835 type:complete len:103 (+) Transcript_17516:80-388(+)
MKFGKRMKDHPERPDPRTQTASAAAICIRNAAAAACSGVQSACPVLKPVLGKEKLVSTSEETKGMFKLTPPKSCGTGAQLMRQGFVRHGIEERSVFADFADR